MTSQDPDLRETLDLLSQVVASISDRLDGQGELLERLVAAQEASRAQPHAAASPDRLAQVTAQAVQNALRPTLTKLVGILEELTGGKTLLRERLRAMDREEGRNGRWHTHPVAVVVGIPLALLLVLAFAMPKAVAATPLTCRAVGGEWWVATEQYPATCLFSTEGRE